MAEEKPEQEQKATELMTVEEAAVYLHFSKTYLYRLARANMIPHVSYGRHIIFRKTDLYNWLGSMVCTVREPEHANYVVNK